MKKRFHWLIILLKYTCFVNKSLSFDNTKFWYIEQVCKHWIN